MPTVNVTRPVERIVVETVSTPVEVSLETRKSGSVDVILNGERAVRITATGYLRRLPLTERAGVRRLPDGRIAIKPAADSAD